MSEVKRYAIYSSGKWEAVVVKVGPWVKWRDFDAQRLRADTAEAESVASHQREARLQEMVSGLSDLLEEVLSEVPHGWGESFSDSELAERIRAALNPNPEAESHE